MNAALRYYESTYSSTIIAVVTYNGYDDEQLVPAGTKDCFRRVSDEGTIACMSVSERELEESWQEVAAGYAETVDSELVNEAELTASSTIPYVDIDHMDDGTIRIRLLKRREAQATFDNPNHEYHNRGFWDLLEYQLCNGWDAPANGTTCFIGFLGDDCPILTDEWGEDDQGMLTSACTVYAYMDYQLYDPVEKLLEHGYITLIPGQAVPLGEDGGEQVMKDAWEHLLD